MTDLKTKLFSIALFSSALFTAPEALSQPEGPRYWAQNGPVQASVYFLRDNEGRLRTYLGISYSENPTSQLRFCAPGSYFASRIDLVLTIGPQGARRPLTLPMDGWCNRDYRNTSPHSAHLSINDHTNKELWDEIFPPLANGERWYALEAAFVSEAGHWDSNFGENYPLILERH